MPLTLILTPHGRLLLEDRADADPLVHDVAERLTNAFARGHGHGLAQLGAAEVQTPMPAVFAYWREFASRYIIAVRTAFTLDRRRALPPIPPPPRADLDPLVLASPAMT